MIDDTNLQTILGHLPDFLHESYYRLGWWQVLKADAEGQDCSLPRTPVLSATFLTAAWYPASHSELRCKCQKNATKPTSLNSNNFSLFMVFTTRLCHLQTYCSSLSCCINVACMPNLYRKEFWHIQMYHDASVDVGNN